MAPPPNKRRRFNQPEEINFDFSARQDYLTGFHKRKLERAKHAETVALKRERENKLETRRQIRAERKAELERYVKSVDESMHKAEETWEGGEDGTGSEEEWKGIEGEEPLDHEENYSDEDRNTTVVVEEVDITRQGFQRIYQEDHEDDDQHRTPTPEPEPKPQPKTNKDRFKTKADGTKKRIWTKEPPAKTKVRRKRMPYETKAERQLTRSKVRASKAKARDRRKGK